MSPIAVSTDLVDLCPASLQLSFFGMTVDLHVAERDARDAAWFFGQHQRDGQAGSARIQSFAYATSGFFMSLLGRTGDSKRTALIEDCRLVLQNEFTDWSGQPSVAPPFAAPSFSADCAVFPGAALMEPSGRALVLTGPNYIGKTSTAIALCRQHGWELLADSLVVMRVSTRTIEPYHGILGFRRGNLAAHRSELSTLDTRSLISPVTGEVVLARCSDFVQLRTDPEPVAGWLHLDVGTRRPRDLDAPVVTTYPPHLSRALLDGVPRAVVVVDPSRDGHENRAARVATVARELLTRGGAHD